ncbi:hypothetical protein E3U43_016825 [Larimichthys crocea]|nr:hypothetical protein E3U43_016825 [Larimichthys crocea]
MEDSTGSIVWRWFGFGRKMLNKQRREPGLAGWRPAVQLESCGVGIYAYFLLLSLSSRRLGEVRR